MPRFEANGSYTLYNDDLSVELSPGESFVIRPAQDFTASLDLRQNLFTGLRAWRARDIAKLNRDIANLDRWTTINNLTLDVARSFYDAVALAEWVEVREIVLEENENQLKVAERLFEVGENSSRRCRTVARPGGRGQTSIGSGGRRHRPRPQPARASGGSDRSRRTEAARARSRSRPARRTSSPTARST